MNNLDFIKKLYNGKNCYSDPMTVDEMAIMYSKSPTEAIIEEFLDKNKVVFLTGNPGDGKTFIIKRLQSAIIRNSTYVEADMNSVLDMSTVARRIVECHVKGCGCLIAINEFPLLKLMREIKLISTDVYKELSSVRKNSVAYKMSSEGIKRIVVVDLNDRNLLDPDRGIIKNLLIKFSEQLDAYTGISTALNTNINALKNEFAKGRILKLFSYLAISGEHYAMRDILGALAYAVTAYDNNDSDEPNSLYYDALFSSANHLLVHLKQFDPVYLSNAELDEALWNGEIQNGWCLGSPQLWPFEEEDVKDAIDLFKSIKRKYYFENIMSTELDSMFPVVYDGCRDIFVNIESEKNSVKKKLIKSMNKLFLSNDEENRMLRIWTTHSYDLSIAASASVSSSFIDFSDIEFLSPSSATWLKGMEFVPNHIILRHKKSPELFLRLDFDFISTLLNISNGYPLCLVSLQYEQALSNFLKSLADYGYAEEYDNGEIIIANRSNGYKQSVYIHSGKYSFNEGEN